jgi:hypothetical protein
MASRSRHVRHGQDQGIEALVVGEPADRQHTHAVTLPASAGSRLSHFGQAVRIDTDGDHLGFLALRPQRPAGPR